MPLLQIDNLTVSFKSDGKEYEVVSGVSLALERGELLAVVGESGCGKSVTCLSVARLLPEPQARIKSGRILVEKRSGEIVDTVKLQGDELRKIRGGTVAYVFQEPSMCLDPVFRIGDQIAEAVELHCPDVISPEDEAVRLLKLAGIPEAEKRSKMYPHELSGGMQQRVMIAMALASRPEILIADEPTTALDVTIQAQILELIDRLRRKNDMSVILITHNLGIVSELADRVCVMYAGKIVETAKVKDLMKHPVHPYTKALIGAVPVLGGSRERLNTIPGAVPAPSDFPSGCRFCERCALRAGLTEKEQEKCRKESPELRPFDNGHFCACHFFEKDAVSRYKEAGEVL